jgi:hypothetical protein
VDAIRQAKGFVSGAKPDATFVFFIVGHGLHDRDDKATNYYLTHGTDLGNLAGTAAPFELIEELLQGIAPCNKPVDRDNIYALFGFPTGGHDSS